MVDGDKVDDFQYELRGSPCLDVAEHGQVLIASGAADAFPECAWLKRFEVDGYLGTLLRGDDGEPLGVLVIADTRPLKKPAGIRAALSLYAERIAREIEGALAERKVDGAPEA